MYNIRSKNKITLVLIFTGEVLKSGICSRSWYTQIENICHTKNSVVSQHSESRIVVFFECFSVFLAEKHLRDRFLNQIDSIFGEFVLHIRFTSRNLDAKKTKSSTLVWVRSATKFEHSYYLMFQNEKVVQNFLETPINMETGIVYLSENPVLGNWEKNFFPVRKSAKKFGGEGLEGFSRCRSVGSVGENNNQ